MVTKRGENVLYGFIINCKKNYNWSRKFWINNNFDDYYDSDSYDIYNKQK